MITNAKPPTVGFGLTDCTTEWSFGVRLGVQSRLLLGMPYHLIDSIVGDRRDNSLVIESPRDSSSISLLSKHILKSLQDSRQRHSQTRRPLISSTASVCGAQSWRLRRS